MILILVLAPPEEFDGVPSHVIGADLVVDAALVVVKVLVDGHTDDDWASF